MKLKLSSIAVGLALAFATASASAFTLYPGAPGNAGTLLEDDDIDFFIDINNNGIINVGDLLLAPLEIGRIVDILPPITGSQNLSLTSEELTAISLIKVIGNIAGDPANRLRFGAPTAAEWSTYVGTPAVSGTMVAFYIGTGATNDYDGVTCTSQVNCKDTASNGTPWMQWGIADADDEWFFDPVAGLPANNPGAVSNIGAATKVGAANFALTAFDNAGLTLQKQNIACGLFNCAGDGSTDIIGSADILGGAGLNNGAFARSDADMTVNVSAVPEPATLALLGLGLLGMGALRRKRT